MYMENVKAKKSCIKDLQSERFLFKKIKNVLNNVQHKELKVLVLPNACPIASEISVSI